MRTNVVCVFKGGSCFCGKFLNIVSFVSAEFFLCVL